MEGPQPGDSTGRPPQRQGQTDTFTFRGTPHGPGSWKPSPFPAGALIAMRLTRDMPHWATSARGLFREWASWPCTGQSREGNCRAHAWDGSMGHPQPLNPSFWVVGSKQNVFGSAVDGCLPIDRLRSGVRFIVVWGLGARAVSIRTSVIRGHGFASSWSLGRILGPPIQRGTPGLCQLSCLHLQPRTPP